MVSELGQTGQAVISRFMMFRLLTAMSGVLGSLMLF